MDQDPQTAEKLKQLDTAAKNLKYELDSAQNRLNYARQKLKGAHESLYHAQDVLKAQKQTPLEAVRKIVQQSNRTAERIPEPMKLLPSFS